MNSLLIFVALAVEEPASMPAKLQSFVPKQGGLTADVVAESARKKAWDVATKGSAKNVAQSRTDAALVDFFPRVQGVARYTRLSPIEQPVVIPGFEDFRFPVILDNWLFQLSATVPVSDYIFRLVQTYQTNTKQRDAAKQDLLAAERKAAADARLAYYAWVKSIVQQEVAQQSRALAQENLRDSERLFAVGRSSKADVLQLQARLASAELAERQAEQALLIAGEQLRRTGRLEEVQTLELGEDLSEPLAKMELGDTALMSEALDKRPELQFVALNIQALKSGVAASRAAYFPRLEGVGSLIYANPNQRFIPQEAVFRLTWEVGAQLVWTFNDTFRAIAQVREAEARVVEADSQAGRVKDALHVEVRQAISEVRNADAGVLSADAAHAAATEAFRVRRELFRSGRASSTELLTAEVEVARARLSAALARIDQRQSRARLDYAVGR